MDIHKNARLTLRSREELGQTSSLFFSPSLNAGLFPQLERTCTTATPLSRLLDTRAASGLRPCFIQWVPRLHFLFAQVAVAWRINDRKRHQVRHR